MTNTKLPNESGILAWVIHLQVLDIVIPLLFTGQAKAMRAYLTVKSVAPMTSQQAKVAEILCSQADEEQVSAKIFILCGHWHLMGAKLKLLAVVLDEKNGEVSVEDTLHPGPKIPCWCRFFFSGLESCSSYIGAHYKLGRMSMENILWGQRSSLSVGDIGIGLSGNRWCEVWWFWQVQQRLKWILSPSSCFFGMWKRAEGNKKI